MQLFPAWSDTALRVGFVVLCALGLTAVAGPMVYMRTPYGTGQEVMVDQPVQFDHRHHVKDDGIDCRYCHDGVERSRYAGVPATETCMGCHSQVWNDSPMLEPVRRSFFSGRAIPWNRVHHLPDFVYFDHSAHVQRGVQCQSCHGAVETMPLVYQAAPLTMQWCLGCHRNPEAQVVSSVPLAHLTHCTACHR